jgi:hypothetical protein
MDGIDKARRRWILWLGAMCREDRDTWIELVSSDFAGWPGRVFDRANLEKPRISYLSPKEDVKAAFRAAIDVANLDELSRLDIAFVDRLLERRHLKEKRRANRR